MSSIEALSIAALRGRLQTAFGLSRAPIQMTTNDRIVRANMHASLKSEKLQYPMMFYSLSGLNESDFMSPTAALHAGLTLLPSTDTIGRLDFTPVSMTFNVTYLTDNDADMLLFCSKWMKASYSGALNFGLMVEGVPVSIQVRTTPNLAVPQKDVTPEQANLFEVNSEITMRTYMTGPFNEAITQVTRIKEVAVSGYTVLPGQEPTFTQSPDNRYPDASIYDYPNGVEHTLAFVISRKNT